MPWFGPRLRELRDRRGLNLPEAAEKLSISTGWLSALEGNMWPPEPQTFWLLVEGLELDPADFRIELPDRSQYGKTGRVKREAGRRKKRPRASTRREPRAVKRA
jgi:transcriptional regulator with XRE-family HTH domain